MLYFCLIKSCLTSRSADNPLPLVSVPRYPTGLLVKGFRTRSHRPDCPARCRSTVENCQELFKNSVGYATFPRREFSCLYRPLVTTRWWHQNYQLWIYRHLLAWAMGLLAWQRDRSLYNCHKMGFWLLRHFASTGRMQRHGKCHQHRHDKISSYLFYAGS